jgi:uncharacterized protein YcaQ
MAEQLSLQQARALNLHALGLAHKAPAKTTPLDVLDQLSVLQLDSVNVFERAHYMPVFSRLGQFEKAQLDALAEPDFTLDSTGVKLQQQATLNEYWVRQASWIRTSDLPLWRFRMANYRAHRRYRELMAEQSQLVAWLKSELKSKGPLTLNQIEHDENRRTGNWWGWSPVKVALEVLLDAGEITCAGRQNFARRYALPEDVLDKSTLDALHSDFDANELERTVLARAIRAEGVSSLKDAASSHSEYPSVIRPRVLELVEQGQLFEVEVPGWNEPVFVHSDWRATLDDVSTASALAAKPSHTTILSPFDQLVRNRDRAWALYDFEYKIEIYTPEPKRIYGYYTLPVLHKGELIGRLDLKSDRKAKELLVLASWNEPWLSAAKVKSSATAVAKVLKDAAKWQGLSQVVVAEKGNYAQALKAALKSEPKSD